MVIGRQRLRFENVECGRSDLSAAHRLGEGRFVDQSAARAIDDPDAAFCFRQPLGIKR